MAEDKDPPPPHEQPAQLAMDRFTQELERFNDRHAPTFKTTALNFLDGMVRGFGFVLGTTLLFGLFLGLLSRMVTIPLIGKTVANIVEIVTQELDRK